MGEVIDIHTHPAFFEPICGTEGLLEQRRQALGLYKTGTARLEHIHNQMQCAGIDRLALLPLDLSTQENQVIVSNEEIRLLVELDPLRFIGFASVDPYRPDALDALEHAFGDLKLAGLKLHPASYPRRPFPRSSSSRRRWGGPAAPARVSGSMRTCWGSGRSPRSSRSRVSTVP